MLAVTSRSPPQDQATSMTTLPVASPPLSASVGIPHLLERETLLVEQRLEGSRIDDLGERGENAPVFLAPPIVQHRNQHEDDVQGKALEVGRRQVELGHGHGGRDLGVQRGRLERLGEVLAADGIVDDVEARPVGVRRDVVGDRLGLEVDRLRTVARDDAHLLLAPAGRVDIGAEVRRQLHRDVPDAAGAAVHQYLRACTGLRALQAFVGGDADERQRRGLAHRQTLRLCGRSTAHRPA